MAKTLHNSTDFEPHVFRENVHFTGDFNFVAYRQRARFQKTASASGVFNGTVVSVYYFQEEVESKCVAIICI